MFPKSCGMFILKPPSQSFPLPRGRDARILKPPKLEPLTTCLRHPRFPLRCQTPITPLQGSSSICKHAASGLRHLHIQRRGAPMYVQICSVYVRMYVCTYVRMYVCTYVRTYVRMYVCLYVCMFVCLYATQRDATQRNAMQCNVV